MSIFLVVQGIPEKPNDCVQRSRLIHEGGPELNPPVGYRARKLNPQMLREEQTERRRQLFCSLLKIGQSGCAGRDDSTAINPPAIGPTESLISSNS
jgi:hypothetical protein